MKELYTIEWTGNKIKIIDQTRLPIKLGYIYIDKLRDLWLAIKQLKIRGAPALGAAAALGVYLGVKDSTQEKWSGFAYELDKTSKYIASSRPTARNLFWAIERMCSIAVCNKDKSISAIKKLLLKEALMIIKEDRSSCRKIAQYGSVLIKNRDSILTICNTGILATIDYGTALGVIYRSFDQGKNIKIYACETRPVLQGARLTSWELSRMGLDTTLICDNMAATLMQQGMIDKVIAGADRIAANGDTANKIGTYNLAVLAQYHKIPFYIAAPVSTFDLSIQNGREISIEQRDPREVTELYFKSPIASKDVKVYNPAFDVTPHSLITAIITDKGIIRPVCLKNVKKLLVGLSE